MIFRCFGACPDSEAFFGILPGDLPSSLLAEARLDLPSWQTNNLHSVLLRAMVPFALPQRPSRWLVK